ncbi:hypothetical protein AN958_01283, partial [Leucoagaricus sp. SymC.cos]
LWGPMNAGRDITVSVSMTILLLKHRQKTPKEGLHVRLTRLIQLIIQAGLATSAVVISYTVLLNFPYFVSQARYLLPGLVMGKMYSSSMMALLNNQVTICGGENYP